MNLWRFRILVQCSRLFKPGKFRGTVIHHDSRSPAFLTHLKAGKEKNTRNKRRLQSFNLAGFLLVVKSTLIWPKLVLTFPAGKAHVFLWEKWRHFLRCVAGLAQCRRLPDYHLLHVSHFMQVADMIKIPFWLVSSKKGEHFGSGMVVWRW